MTDIIDEILDTPRLPLKPVSTTTLLHSPRHQLPDSLKQEIHKQWEQASQAVLPADHWSDSDSAHTDSTHTDSTNMESRSSGTDESDTSSESANSSSTDSTTGSSLSSKQSSTADVEHDVNDIQAALPDNDPHSAPGIRYHLKSLLYPTKSDILSQGLIIPHGVSLYSCTTTRQTAKQLSPSLTV